MWDQCSSKVHGLRFLDTVNTIEEEGTTMICRTGFKKVSAISLLLMTALLVTTGAADAQTTLYALDHSKNELWSISTSPPLTSTLIGGANSVVIIAEIEEGGGVIYGADTDVNNLLHWIDPSTGVIFDTLVLTFPPEGNVLTSLEFIQETLYAGLTTERGGDTYLSTVDLVSGVVTVVGQTNVGFPLGGLTYDPSRSAMFAISAAGSPAELFTIDLGSGAATSVGPVTLGGQPFGATALEFGADGVLYALANRKDPLKGRLLTIDPDTAIATDLGPTNIPGPIALTEGSLVFGNGFESGDTSAWSSTVP